MIETQPLTNVFRCRKRGAARTVDGVNFRCEPGRIYGLLGANGVGKTTTLRLLATLLKPTSGTIRLADGVAVREPERIRARIGFLATGTALYGRLTARETVEYFRRLHGVNAALLQERIRDLFSTLGDGRVCRPSLRQVVQWDETEGIHRPDAGPWPAGDDF